MIKLVQGFDVCSPLPIDGRILLSKKEMYEIDDNILPEKYFAICKEDGKLYLYDKSNIIAEDIGRWRLADETLDERITEEVETLNTRVDDEVKNLNDKIDGEVAELDDKIDNKVAELDSKVDTEVSKLDNKIDSEVAKLNTEDEELHNKIDNYKSEKNLVDASDLTNALEPYSLILDTGNKLHIDGEHLEDEFRFKIQLLNENNDVLSTSEEVDLPLESMVISGDYDSATKEVVLILKDGNTVRFSVADLIDGLVSEFDFNSHVNNMDVHIREGERDKWDKVTTAVQPENVKSFINAGENVSIVEDGNNITINAKDTTYTAGSGVTIVDNVISSAASAPTWDLIQGEDPLTNEALKGAFDKKLNIDEYESDQASLETLLDSMGNAIGDEVSARAQADEDLSDRIDSLNTNLTALSGDLTAEVTRAQGKENELSGSISDLDTRLSGAISDEEIRAKGAEDALRNSITSQVSEEATNRKAADNDIINSINSLKTTEIKNLQNKDAELESSLTAEISRATAAESSLQSKIDDEKTSRETADASLSQRIDGNVLRIEAIESKIPNDATADNQLADKDFVNSSIATNTATFRGTYESVEKLPSKSQITDLKNNDYAFVISEQNGNPEYDRYKYNETSSSWVFEYTLNNSSFTAEQWAAINSDATKDLISQITTNKNNIELLNENKVGVEDGKSLIATAEIRRLEGITTGATKVTVSNPGNGNIQVQSRENGEDSTETINVYNLTTKKVTDVKPYVFGEGLISTKSESDGQVTVKFSSNASITVSSEAWQANAGGFGFIANINLTSVPELNDRITINSEPFLDIDMTNATSISEIEAINDAWCLIYKAITGENSISLYAYDKPTIALTINVKGY